MPMPEQTVDGLNRSPKPLPEISTTRDRAEQGIKEVMTTMPVSYTHLTLPTSDLV